MAKKGAPGPAIGDGDNAMKKQFVGERKNRVGEIAERSRSWGFGGVNPLPL